MMTNAEFLLLGLVSEMPRHGYELEKVIEDRGMREWTQIGFSSIYFVLGKLQKSGLVSAEAPEGVKARKVFSITPEGRTALIAHTQQSLSTYQSADSTAMMGMLHWSALSLEDGLAALRARALSIDREMKRLDKIRLERQPLPDFIEAIFDLSERKLDAEKRWVSDTLAYMETKP